MWIGTRVIQYWVWYAAFGLFVTRIRLEYADF